MRCGHCPIPAGRPCAGEKAPSACERMDPSHPRFDPGFRAVLEESSRQLARGPSVARMAVNLAGDLWAWAVSGFTTASDEEQARRRSICAACPEWAAEARRCRICGCYTDAKIRLKTAHCPLDPPKW